MDYVILCIVGGPVIMIITVAGLTTVFNLPEMFAVRARMVQPKYRVLPLFILLSPTVTFATGLGNQLARALGMPLGFGIWSFIISSLFTAALASCWLTIPKDDPQHVRFGSAVVLTITFLICDAFIGIGVGCSRGGPW